MGRQSGPDFVSPETKFNSLSATLAELYPGVSKWRLGKNPGKLNSDALATWQAAGKLAVRAEYLSMAAKW